MISLYTLTIYRREPRQITKLSLICDLLCQDEASCCRPKQLGGTSCSYVSLSQARPSRLLRMQETIRLTQPWQHTRYPPRFDLTISCVETEGLTVHCAAL